MSARLVAAGQSGRWGTVLAVAGLMLALFLVALDQTVVGTALPKIVAELNGFKYYAWVTTAYLLASTSMIPIIGKLGDIYGRKWFIVGGIVVFLTGSALAGAAWGMTELILFRGIQGLGAGMIISTIIPLSLFRSRVFASASLLTFFLGIGMFGIILYSPLFVQGVLGKSATGAGTVLTPLVFSMAAVGVIGGQIIARVKRVKPFMLFGTVVMTFGVYLLTTLDVNSTPPTVAFYLAVTGLELGRIMPTTNLAVQSTAQKRMLGVATSATQFTRSIGSTVGTAVIGSIATKGYAEGLAANALSQAHDRLVSALENPQARTARFSATPTDSPPLPSCTETFGAMPPPLGTVCLQSANSLVEKEFHGKCLVVRVSTHDRRRRGCRRDG